jgi:hypothetical protein
MVDDPRDPQHSSGTSNDGGGSSLRALGEYYMIGIVFPLALLVGFFAGQWIGGLLGAETGGAVVGLLLGTAAAFWNLVVTLQRIEGRRSRGG